MFAQAAWQVSDLEAAATHADAFGVRTKKARVEAERTEGNAMEVRNEAALLRVEYSSDLGARASTDPDNSAPDPARRYMFAMSDLERLGDWQPSRIAREEAVQTVEAFLLNVRLP